MGIVAQLRTLASLDRSLHLVCSLARPLACSPARCSHLSRAAARTKQATRADACTCCRGHADLLANNWPQPEVARSGPGGERAERRGGPFGGGGGRRGGRESESLAPIGARGAQRGGGGGLLMQLFLFLSLLLSSSSTLERPQPRTCPPARLAKLRQARIYLHLYRANKSP